jgi:hypothetical protein
VKLRNIIAIILFACALGGCGRDEPDTAEYAYVAVPQARMRDRVAAVYNNVATLHSGDRVRVLDRSNNKQWLKVRMPGGEEGWIQQRYLISQETYAAFKKLEADHAAAPPESTASARRDINIHLRPERLAEKLYQVKEGSKVELLQRTSTPRAGLKVIPRQEEPVPESEKSAADKAEEATENAAPAAQAAPEQKKAKPARKPEPKAQAQLPGSAMEDWWLVRDPKTRHVGWVLARMLDVEVPEEIIQYAEGARIIAARKISEVQDKEQDRMVPQYVVLFAENRDGLPYDFDQVRVFTWNTRRHRYETAYREHNVNGVLPFTLSQEDFGKEGMLPVFIVRQKDENGNISERKYKMNGVMVRRVLAPGEEPQRKAARPKRR